MHVFTSSAGLSHHTGPGHPERAQRLSVVLDALRADSSLQLAEATPATVEPLLTRHDRTYLETIASLSRTGSGDFGADTPVSSGTWDAVLGAAGASLAALEHALDNNANTFAAIRPPGHHALRDTGMGFCFVNHVAVLAAEALRRGAQRVLIIDWDVHHGNGTQALVEAEHDTHFVSMHQWPWYPGTGAANDRGVGNCFNLPQPAGLPPATYVEVLWSGIVAATVSWTPDVVLISAGYDAMRGDPLGGFTLEPEHYPLWIERLRERFSATPIVGLMEGGYNPARLAGGVLATVKAMG